MKDIITDVIKYFLDMLGTGAGDAFSLVEYLPDILRESGSMFGIFALVAIIISLMVVFFFKNSETRQKERVFVYTTLFLLTLAFSALVAGASSGFQTGREIAITDPALVELSPATVKALETHLQTEGKNITDKNKSRVLSEAISAYFESGEAEPIAADPSVEDTSEPELLATVGAGSSSAPDGFIFQSRGCSQRDSTITCDTLVTNTNEDIDIRLFASGHRANSRLVDGEGNQYAVSTIKVGNIEAQNYQVVPFASNIPVKVTLVVTNASSRASQISLVDLLGNTSGSLEPATLSFQARDVRVGI